MNKNAIIIIGGGLVKEKGKWRTTNFNEGDNFAVQGDRLRVAAADYIFKNNPEQILIALGGKGQYENIPNVPTVAEVIKRELVEIGVPVEKIIKEDQSGNTWQQLQELKKIIVGKKLENVIIISNEYHLPRIKAMVEKDLELNKMLDAAKIKLQSAEEIIIEHEPDQKKKIESVYKSKAMRERIALEQKGVIDIKKGRYKLK
ncbi:MAG: YdcF family protein [Candidatus Falkowbacteria bacterium]